ncbi:MAG: hypothetical protein M4579_003381 [Chaenotheca gracillima]|nr:MAG: hypothetical protein M4579_003381 [Chaenotheca gracillima]
MAHGEKRQRSQDIGDQAPKAAKVFPPLVLCKSINKKWQVSRNDDERGEGGAKTTGFSSTIEPGDSGIWATCDKGREGKCTSELRDLFDRYAEDMYGQQLDEADEDGGAHDPGDVEADVQKELAEMRRSKSDRRFHTVKLDMQCVLFFKVRSPVVPTDFVRQICQDALSGSRTQQTRFTKRLTPMTLMGKANEKSLNEVAKAVLAPHFHNTDGKSVKFAIRPTIRNHNILKRDMVIHQIATMVGPGHSVDLKQYELLILVEIYKNVCGMSVVGSDFEALKRYNLAEIHGPTPKPVTATDAEAEAVVTSTGERE